MSSVSPAAVRDFGARVSAASRGNAVVVDAPVSGGTEGARDGTLAIMAGAAETDFQRLLPLFDAMGGTVRRLGPLGSGSLAKACNQLIVGTTTAALAEAAELAERSGMDVGALYEVLSGGLAGSRVLDIVGPRLAAKDYAPTGPAKFMHKDLSFVLESAAGRGRRRAHGDGRRRTLRRTEAPGAGRPRPRRCPADHLESQRNEPRTAVKTN